MRATTDTGKSLHSKHWQCWQAGCHKAYTHPHQGGPCKSQICRGWGFRDYKVDLSSKLAGAKTVTVRLGLSDSQSINYKQHAIFDNIKVSTACK